MPLDVAGSPEGPITLDQFEDGFAQAGIDARDEAALSEVGPLFSRLGKNKEFLADVILDKLESALAGELVARETGQVVPIKYLDDEFFLRAVIWPSKKDYIFDKTGPDLFYYGRPHDHNFAFLTYGYEGPGYASDYYTPSDGKLDGAVGGEVALDFVERKSLKPDTMMLYRAFTDIHSQLPPETTSVSLNVVSNPRDVLMETQRIFDDESRKIAAFFQTRANFGMIMAGSLLKGEEFVDRLDHLSTKHDDPLYRYFGLRAKAQFKGADGEVPYLRSQLGQHDGFVDQMLVSYLRLFDGPEN